MHLLTHCHYSIVFSSFLMSSVYSLFLTLKMTFIRINFGICVSLFFVLVQIQWINSQFTIDDTEFFVNDSTPYTTGLPPKNKWAGVLPIESIVKMYATDVNNETLALDWMNLHTDEPYTVQCLTLRPLAGPKWSFVLKNSSKICFGEGAMGKTNCLYDDFQTRKFVDIRNVGHNGYGNYYDFRTSNITFKSADINKILCNVPIMGLPIVYVSFTVPVNISESTEPSFHESNKNETVCSESKGCTIDCGCLGLPKPTTLWTRDDNKPLYAVQEEDSLRFDQFRKDWEGTYNCLCKNFKGNYSYSVRVNLEDGTGFWDKAFNAIVISATIAVCVVIMLISLAFLYHRYQRTKIALLRLNDRDVDYFFNGRISDDADDNYQFSYDLPYNVDFEISKEDIIMDEEEPIGDGEFGQVFKGHLKDSLELVAFKTTKPNCSMDTFKALLLELKIRTCIGTHENIVSLIGACTAEIRNGILFIAMEFCELGSLEDYLNTNRRQYGDHQCDPTQDYQYFPTDNPVFWFTDLIKWSYEISCGMERLATLKIIHSDLAARNILLTANKTAKITDFGLSRKLYQYANYIKLGEEPLPWRWMSIESIKYNQFSIKSDIWSFGITLWEIFSLGSVPYPGLSWSLEFGSQLELGLRNMKPTHATEEIYDVMKNCWLADPEARPTFQQVKSTFSQMMCNKSDAKHESGSCSGADSKSISNHQT